MEEGKKWGEARSYRSDDRDLERSDNDLRVFQGGNGDWYVMVVPHGQKLGPAVRLTMSGAPREQRMVGPAIANVYRAMGGERLIPMLDDGLAHTDVRNHVANLHARIAELEALLAETRAAADRWRRDAVEDKPAREVLVELRTLLGVPEGKSVVAAAKGLLATVDRLRDIIGTARNILAE